MSQFHDGSMNGLLIEGRDAYIFLSTNDHEQFVLELENTVSLKANEFREGSIVFDVVLRKGNELTCADVIDLFGFTDEDKALVKLEQLLDQHLYIVEINSSYGCSCLALAEKINLISKQEWMHRYFAKRA